MFKTIVSKTFRLSEYKNLEIDFHYYSGTLLSLQYVHRAKQDHWGWVFEIAVLGFCLIICKYDSRHWVEDVYKNKA